MIPKKIHYCWLSGDPIPEPLKTYVESWKDKLPDYEFILWDKSRFDIHSVKWVEQAYNAKKYAFAADYIRLYAVYNYGGFYLDMDVEVVKSFNDILDRPYIMGCELANPDLDKPLYIEAGIFGAEKGCELLKWCLEFYDGRDFPYLNEKGQMIGLPPVMTMQIGQHIKSEITKTPDFSKGVLQLLPYDFLTTKRGDTGVVKMTKNTYTVHHFAGSWVGKDYRHEIKVWLVRLLGESFVRKVTNLIFSRK